MLVLGINYCEHDSSACLIRDGELLFAVAEERLSRQKHDNRFPVRAIKACLDFGGIQPDELDCIAFGWSKPGVAFRHDLKCFLRGTFPPSKMYVLNSVRKHLSMWHQRGGVAVFTRHFGPTKAKVLFVDHHLAHAISAYAFSGFDEATVVVVDGRGAWEATSCWYGRDGKLEHVFTIPFPNSLGLFYAEFTHYLGFAKFSDEWKVMGLAPYGSDGVNLDNFIRIYDNGYYWVNAPVLLGKDAGDTSGIERVLGPRRLPETEIDSRHKDIAFAVQSACEQAMLNLVRLAVEKTRCRKLCLAGGVALNCKANGLILQSGLVDDIFVQPAAADDGVALGAALAPYLGNWETGKARNGRLPIVRMRHVYLGPEYSDEEIERTLRTYKLPYQRLDNPADVAAELLAQGNIIGWFQGRMEFGPRALGSRSILADPRDPTMKDKVNQAVKFREVWRPFAPSLLAEAAPGYLDSYQGGKHGVWDIEHGAQTTDHRPQTTDLSPFMILSFPVKEDKRAIIPAVTHVDGSARPQTVERDVNPLYWDLIKAFEQRTGVPVVMNTSFNLRGEPIVCSPTDAVRTFFTSGMDYLIMGNFIIGKEKG